MPLQKKDFTLIPVTKVTTPRDGQVVMLDRWWVVVVEGGIKHVLGYRGRGFKSLAPQCHKCRGMVDRRKPYSAAEGTFSAELLPVAYWESGYFHGE